MNCYFRFSKSVEIDSYFLRDNFESPELNVALSILLAKYYRNNSAFLKSGNQTNALRHYFVNRLLILFSFRCSKA